MNKDIESHIDDKDDLLKQVYELVKGVKLSLLLIGNLYLLNSNDKHPEILIDERMNLLDRKGKQT
ncbi:hypothetical protein LCGC14_2172550 [marine sediment metagenome]|uniref:Uncharacterized protein n=1 Tax=marine sediment metagenome TaxID=412755 RepID=A0A0F9DPQ3_9ZZZZ